METEDILNPVELADEAEAMVFKFGGDNAADFEENLELARQMIAKRQKFVFVFSAFKDSSDKYKHLALVDQKKGFNTTSHLIKMADAAKDKNFPEAMKYLSAVKAFYVAKIEEKIPEGEVLDLLLECVEGEFERLRKVVEEAATLKQIGLHKMFCEQGSDKMYFPIQRDIFSFTGFGEIAVEKIYEAFFTKMGLKVAAVDSNAFSIEIFGEQPQDTIDREPKIVDKVRDTIKSRVLGLLEEVDGAVSSGRLPGAAESRGYSDVAGIVVSEIVDSSGRDTLFFNAKQDSILSADRKLVPDAEPVLNMTRKFAVEFFGPNGADAGALHPDAAKRAPHIDVIVGNPHKPEKGFTLISDKYKPKMGPIEIVQRKEKTVVLEVESLDMADREDVMGLITHHLGNVSLGHFFTEEGSISITFNDEIDDIKVSELERTLTEKFGVKYDLKVRRDLTLLFCMGNKMNILRENLRASEVLDREGIEVMGFQSKGEMSIKYLVPAAQADKAVKLLHAELIKKKQCKA